MTFTWSSMWQAIRVLLQNLDAKAQAHQPADAELNKAVEADIQSILKNKSRTELVDLETAIEHKLQTGRVEADYWESLLREIGVVQATLDAFAYFVLKVNERAAQFEAAPEAEGALSKEPLKMPNPVRDRLHCDPGDVSAPHLLYRKL